MTLTLAEQGAMPRTTATEIAERTYAAGVARRSAQAAGLLPDPRATFRPTIDGRALRAHADAAFDAHEASLVTPAERAEAAALLAADIDERFPAGEMEVLARYDAAKATDLVHVVLADDRATSLPIEPRLLPVNANAFTAAGHDGRRPVPLAAQAVFDRLLDLRRERRAIEILLGWPSRFKSQHQRWPQWAEIEQHWPILGRYLADRRDASRETEDRRHG